MWWLPLTIKDVIDILLLAGLLYYIYNVLRNSGSRALFTGILTFIAVWILVSQVLEMRLVGAVLDKFVNIGFLVIIIIFQEEIKKFLVTIGSAERWKRFRSFFREKHQVEEEERQVAPILLACMNMSRKKTGALIVLQQNIDLSVWMHAGEKFSADVNARLIENIFFKNSPLHDGAMLIARGRIRAAGCILPVANNPDLNKDLGLRHRAALGMSQKTDALIIIISEERGTISVAHLGEIITNVTAEQLQEMLSGSSIG
ncbi:MAG: diadenylate cyclase CdaA [Porphyromonadaceae bacterium]|nr:diadenylate cyclase CdaA [Porphyromonadaceae bacterium]